MNKKIKINDRTNNINGTSLVGYVKATYEELVEAFGEPDYDMDKSTVHWSIQAPNGCVATVYDYKNYSIPTGEYAWHVGGHTIAALLLVEFMTGKRTIAQETHTWNPYGGGNDQ
jgi:hypothetical protein